MATAIVAIGASLVIASPAYADSYTSSYFTYSGRRATLWMDTTKDLWHGEISDAKPGDAVELDWTDSTHVAACACGYSSTKVGVPTDANYANTSDHGASYARVCIIVSGTRVCTDF